MRELRCDVVIVGSGAGGGTAAAALAPLVAQGRRVLVLEKGPRVDVHERTGREIEMSALYEDSGGFLTAEGTVTLAFGRAYGGSTLVYTGTSLPPPRRVIDGWDVPGLTHGDLAARAARHAADNNVHLLPPELINDNNRLFQQGCAALGWDARQFPINVRGCLGASLCNLACPNGAKQGTDNVQLPAAERLGVEVITRAEALRLDPTERTIDVRVSPKLPGTLGRPPEWEPGEYRIHAGSVVLAGGSMGSAPLLLRSGLRDRLPRLGHGFTCHPAHILVGEHERPITNDVGHPKSFYLDHWEQGYVLETCMYFPFITAKNLTGFGAEHSRLMQAFRRLQMILVLALDEADPRNRIDVNRRGETVVHYTFTDRVVDALVEATRASARIFFAAGAARVHAPEADPPLIERGDAGRVHELITRREFMPGRISVSAAHLMGGCGMGHTAADSVTDGWGRVHGLPWLRVADGSLFPDSLQINPYLTIMALADRAASTLGAELAQLVDAV